MSSGTCAINCRSQLESVPKESELMEMVMLTWRNVGGFYLQASPRSGGDYAVVDLARLRRRRTGFEAHHAPLHRRGVMVNWISLGVFPDIVSAQQRCLAHLLGDQYTPLARCVMPPRAKRKKSRVLLLGYKSSSHRWASDSMEHCNELSGR
jgi:hypothetical protein